MMRRRAAAWGIAAVAIAWAWQFLTVRYNYGGNWTALFCIAPHMPRPDFLRSEKLYIFAGSEGSDGQVYHLIAHDPWLRRGAADAIVGPAVFYQRILVPALAWSLALSRDRWIDPAYYGVILGFIFLGAYWSARIAMRLKRPAAWGLAFLLTPATLFSIDRMTVDVAVAACVTGFMWHALDGPNWRVFAILACAALAKEQAAPIIAGYALFLAARRQFAGAAGTLAAALPAFAWFVHLGTIRRAPRVPSGSWYPLAGFFDAVVHPASYHFAAWKNATGVAFDYIALAGFVAALAWTLRFAIQRRWNPRTAPAYALAISTLTFRNPVLFTVYNFGRGLTPWFLLLAIEDLPEHAWLAALPMALIDSRIALNFVSQILGVFHALTGIDVGALLK